VNPGVLGLAYLERVMAVCAFLLWLSVLLGVLGLAYLERVMAVRAFSPRTVVRAE